MRNILFTFALILASTLSVSAQDFSVSFGGETDTSAPIELAADTLTVDQETGEAVFDGNVEISQGEMVLKAGFVRVLYSDETGDLVALRATGGVSITSGRDTATADAADYDVENGILQLSGNVALDQQGAKITAQRMDVDLAKNTASLSGRVRTVLQQGGN